MRIPMKGFTKLTPLNEALSQLLEHTKPPTLEAERIILEQALGRVLAEDVVAPFDIPPFNRSAVDGYAVRAEDTFGASPSNPAVLSLRTEVIEAGMPPKFVLGENEAVEIYTGAPLPKGADAVVMAENAVKENAKLHVLSPVSPWQNVSRKGEDFEKGQVALRRGHLLQPWDIGVLASFNLSEVQVLRRVKAAVVATGCELIPPGGGLEEGKIIDSSRPLVKAFLEASGCEPIDLGIAPDDLREVANLIRRVLSEADFVVVIGGTSVGKRDLVPEAVKSLKPTLYVHGLSIKPGKPTGFAVVSEKPVFMLSGYPVAALVGFEAIIKPWLHRKCGLPAALRPKAKAKLARRVASTPGVRDFLRVKLVKKNETLYAEPLRLTGSGLLSSITEADALLIIPEEVEGYDEGAEVEVEILNLDAVI